MRDSGEAEMLEFLAIVFVVLLAWVAIEVAAVLVRAVLWLVLLPFRALWFIVRTTLRPVFAR